MKADVLTISKMWYFLGVALFKGELLPVEVGSNSKKISGKALPLRKKDTATILIFEAVSFFRNGNAFC